MLPQNEAQRMMQRWTSLLPYNSSHVLRTTGRADIERWRTAAAGPLKALGIEAAAEITNHPELISGLEVEINRPFSAGASPLRFFAIDGNGDDHHFGVTFDHWVSDSESIRLLMQRIFSKYAGNAASDLPPLRVAKRPFGNLFCRASVPAVVAESVRNYLRHRRAYRIHIPQPLDFSCGVQHLRFADGLVDRLRESSRRLGTSVNDLFLAAAAQTLGRHTARDRAARRRRTLRPARDCVALSTAMDIRPLARVPLDHEFGFFLSYYNVLVKNPETRPLPDLARHIAALTKRMKSNGRGLHFFEISKLINMYWDRCRQPDRRALMFHKLNPTLGGISNVNLTGSWVERDDGVLDYLRVAPTGPAVPLVFALTTIGERLSLCLTHRTTVFSSAAAAELAEDFRERLASF